jgi:photosystem II stability/assembly factor-like uncharacterized protein
MKLMKTRSALYAALGVTVLAVAGALYAYNSSSIRATTVTGLAEETHFHGIAVDANDPARLYLATHHGLFVVGLDGQARRVSETRDDFMGFTAHPTDPSILYASGHPAGGGNLGFTLSKDGGRSWSKIANGVNGPVDFHQMDVSKADPRVIYGVYGDLQRSADGGRTWTRVAPAPDGIIALAASSTDANILYAATQGGLLRSTDGGLTWKAAHESASPATMVYVTRAGDLYAFVLGVGVVRANEKDLAWQVVNNGFGDDFVVHFAADPTDQQRLYAIVLNAKTRTQRVVFSRDGGANWAQLGIV